MGDHEYAGLLPDYLRRIASPSEEAWLVASVPWWLGLPCEAGPLLEALRLEAPRFAELPRLPTFSLIAPLSRPRPQRLHELILSLRCQSYLLWELILVDDAGGRRDHLAAAEYWTACDRRVRLIRPDRRRGLAAAKELGLSIARGSHVAFVEDDALIHPSALGIVARHLNVSPDLNLVYSHEARLDDATGGIAAFLRKPEFDRFTMIRQNYLGHLTVVGRELLDAARRGGAAFRPEFEGVEDHDLMLRIALTGQVRPMNVPFFLYYSRASRDAMSGRGRPAAPDGPETLALIDDLLPSFYPGARWDVLAPSAGRGNVYPGIHLRSLPDRSRPALLVLVPFKDQAELTVKCLDSIEGQVHDLDVRVILIDNRSSDPETPRRLRGWLDAPRRNRYEIAEHDGPFNYARMHNAAIARAGGDAELLLFLNNDAELVSVDCLQTMAMQLLADDSSGFVGLRLMYPDDRAVQHGGIKFERESLYVCGFHRADHARDPGDHVGDEKIVFGVTFACAMTRRATYERLGGLEEILYPNAYGDVDLCARAIEAGLKNYYFGTLVGRHHESRSRPRTLEDPEYAALHESHGATFARWRLRDLSCSVVTALPPGMAASARPALPLRYRIADGINAALKVVLGPGHRAARAAAVHSVRLARAGRSAIASGRSAPPDRPSRPGPQRPAPRGPHRRIAPTVPEDARH